MTGPGAVARPWASPTRTRTPRVRRFPAAPTRRVARAHLRRLRATLLPRPTGEQVARRRYLRPTTLTASGAVVAERVGPLSSRRSDPCCLASPYPLVAVAGRAVSQRGAGMPGRPQLCRVRGGLCPSRWVGDPPRGCGDCGRAAVACLMRLERGWRRVGPPTLCRTDGDAPRWPLDIPFLASLLLFFFVFYVSRLFLGQIGWRGG